MSCWLFLCILLQKLAGEAMSEMAIAVEPEKHPEQGRFRMVLHGRDRHEQATYMFYKMVMPDASGKLRKYKKLV